jgi:hypothetical protein
LIYNNNNLNGSFLYFNGDFDPVKVCEMTNSDQFGKLSEGLIQQFSKGNQGIGQDKKQ